MKFPYTRATFVSALLLLVGAAPGSATAQDLVASTLPNAPDVYLRQSPSPAPEVATGLIQGIVTDIHGGLVPEASVTLERKGHAALRETTTDASGHFAFAALAPGTYTVLISAAELKTDISQPIALAPGQIVTLPAIALAVATANTSITVSANSTAVAEEELHRELEQRVVGILPNFYTSYIYDAAPLNTPQKFHLVTRSLIDPTAFIGVGITAAVEQERDTFPSWGNSDLTSYAKRYAAGYGDETLTRLFSYGIYTSLFHQDPRYFYLGPTNKTSTRIWHAISSGIITRGDNGRTQPNYSYLLGSASGGALSSLYHPASDGPGKLAGLNVGVGIGGKAIQSLIREFVWPRFTTHVPAYANGKTSQTDTTAP